MKNRNKLPEKLIWMDLEMTGLDPETDKIIEVGVIITDFEFNELDTYEAIVKQPSEYIEKAKKDPWWQENDNGLLDKIADGVDEQKVVARILELLEKHFEYPAVLAGNSIHQDRRFIRKWWPEVESKLHYRMLDVSSFKVWMMGKHGTVFHKPDQHRALEDIRGSIAELKKYVKDLKLENGD